MISLMTQWQQITQDLHSGLTSPDRFDRLLATIRQVLNCDASALLVYQDQQFTPLAINGLATEVLGRRFVINAHPRLEAIARAGDVVRFPADSDLADPYDGLIPNLHDSLHVHSCIGLPLLIDDSLIGAITIDAFDPGQFDSLRNEDLRFISALAASGLHTALLIERLEKQTHLASVHPGAMASHTHRPQEMIGQSNNMLALKEQINAVANTDLTVLIMGETGVGKELVASAIHHQSPRANQQLVYLNCAALPESVAESELFGHVKGAFTGAISHRKGKFEQADGGSLFLDEIGELSLSLQAKLLRALQYGDIQRVGDDRHITVNVRIVAATNRHMANEVKAGRFRADLYHRLSVFPIAVPPLRQRDDDAVLLAGFFAERMREKLHIDTIRLSDTLINQIRHYPWPGNIRELEHVISRAAVIAKSSQTNTMNVSTTQAPLSITLSSQHLNLPEQKNSEINHVDAKGNNLLAHGELMPESLDTSPLTVDVSNKLAFKQATQAFQKQLIEQRYQQQQQNWAATARDLGLDTGNLHRLAKRLGIK
ncbi:nitric oxide reductase transcriptional regulator NorR [Shewanella intestini]|uniref:Nitric oxide reductase transcriptional regulator NorR n=1 Tax=Shewanella intestini TaxID=2017544 RepID=A0ABS5I5H7_9GAMM|nr:MULTISPECIES: nitric oxide reductase transcriptional regulator NorR [Shewanella]MBR9728570.1 nitric oxide reductase transcriptional regulator NorR [Shewanella intestini]MRG36389.1 nitric oxide reductase transcriptional regulator NorR [Shewanella sp. XMDDZSB0408]